MSFEYPCGLKLYRGTSRITCAAKGVYKAMFVVDPSDEYITVLFSNPDSLGFTIIEKGMSTLYAKSHADGSRGKKEYKESTSMEFDGLEIYHRCDDLEVIMCTDDVVYMCVATDSSSFVLDEKLCMDIEIGHLFRPPTVEE